MDKIDGRQLARSRLQPRTYRGGGGTGFDPPPPPPKKKRPNSLNRKKMHTKKFSVPLPPKKQFGIRPWLYWQLQPGKERTTAQRNKTKYRYTFKEAMFVRKKIAICRNGPGQTKVHHWNCICQKPTYTKN